MLSWKRAISKMATIHPNFIPLLLLLWIQSHITESVQYSHLLCRYQFHVQGLTWMEAYNVCKDKNMTLFHLNDLNEFSTIQSLHAKVNKMISSTIESAWFGLYVASQSDGVHYCGPDCQHPSLISHLKTTELDSSTMCGMFSRSGDDHDYQVIGCSESLPYVCEETMSGSVPCFLKLEEKTVKQLTVDRMSTANNTEACAEQCFTSPRPGFVYNSPTCSLLKSQSNGELKARNGYYTNKIIDWISYTLIGSTMPPEEVCSMISSTTISSMSTDLVTASASSTTQTTSSAVLSVSSTTQTTSSAVLSASSTTKTTSSAVLSVSFTTQTTSSVVLSAQPRHRQRRSFH